MVTTILSISGSLRKHSTNGAVLEAFALLAPRNVVFSRYDGLGNLPPFNPDFEEQGGDAVVNYRKQLREADGILISSPEYAHGVPGVLKNALDWVVGSGELVDKPVALINVSPTSTYAHASLIETLTVMSAKLVQEACVVLPFWNKKLDPAGIAAHPELREILRNALTEFLRVASPNSH